MSVRKRIGLLVGHTEESFQKAFIEGFLDKAFEFDYDVCVFATYNKYQETTAREIGENTIFSLINFDLFDGFVCLFDTIQTPGIAESLEAKIKEKFNGPVICIDWTSKYFTNIKTEHYSGVKKTISHLIESHGYEDIAYLTGKEDHPHSKERLQAFIDCMKEHNLPIKENRIFYGDFWFGTGIDTVNFLIQNDSMPRAIACANDYMAIGVCQALEKNGYSIPDDVAVIAYDSVVSGQTSPKPITSAPIPARGRGCYSAIVMNSLLENKEIPEGEEDVSLFIGTSCGCKTDDLIKRNGLRDRWETIDFDESFYSRFNHMTEDILTKTDFPELMDTILAYTYQIKGYELFTLCLNSQFKNLSRLHDKDIPWDGYTDDMLPIMSCTPNSKFSPLNYDKTFNKELLIPELHKDRPNPNVFYFTPLHFEDRCLGYAVIAYGKDVKCFEENYWFWLRTIMQGLECFRRIDALKQANMLLQSSQTRDSLTGLYNYQGLLHQIDGYYGYIGAIAVDIKGLADINTKHGRFEGNRAVNTIANLLNNVVENGICCRLGNGEFAAVIFLNDDSKDSILAIEKEFKEKLKELDGFSYTLDVYIGTDVALVENFEDFEHLINSTVGQKNSEKLRERKTHNGQQLSDEEKKEVEIVKAILDENRFTYHFQPIVNAKTGDIYAYEALMRADVVPYLSPLKILKYADYMQRLYDVERSTFFNILDRIEKEQMFRQGKKVFINSIPKNRLQGEDASNLEARMKYHSGSVVVEITEQAEIPDEELNVIKENYVNMGIETAVDDYGTGYSNVTNLLRYMPNYVKIDRTLLTKIQESPQKQHFVREIIEFAHDNNIKALAEGIETAEELQFVIHLGVDLIQGYYTAKPAAEIVPEIDEIIKAEILRYQQQERTSKGQMVYIAGKEGKIFTAKLIAEKFSEIEVIPENLIHKNFAIVGMPGRNTNLSLKIKDGYKGVITLENVFFSAKKAQPCIQIGRNCDVKLILVGDNQFNGGGICVPEDSSLVLEGEGNLLLNLIHDDFYGIGNGLEEKHGNLSFEQDGCIEIHGSGSKGVGIGSGLGGKISISGGKYVIELMGEEGVAVGSVAGSSDLDIKTCNFDLNLSSSINVGLGSIKGNVKISILHILFQAFLGGMESVGIGSIKGDDSDVFIENSNINLNIRAPKLCGIGGGTINSSVRLIDAGFVISIQGKECISLGNFARTGKVNVHNCDLVTRIKSALDYDMGAEEDNIKISNARCYFNLNGEEITRTITLIKHG